MLTKSEILARLKMVNATPEQEALVNEFLDNSHDAFIEGIPIAIARIIDPSIDKTLASIKESIDRLEGNGLYKYTETKESKPTSPKRDFSYIEDPAIRSTAEAMFPREDSVWIGGPTWEQGQVLEAIRNRK